jgi:hypothetical protein
MKALEEKKYQEKIKLEDDGEEELVEDNNNE